MASIVSLPINLNTFKRSFLDGNGSFEVISDDDIWQTVLASDAPFPEDADSVVDIRLGASATKDLTLGSDQLTIGLSAGGSVVGQILLLRPGSADPLAEQLGLDGMLGAGQFFVAVRLAGQADVGASGSFSHASSAIGATFGVSAGGAIELIHVTRHEQATPARTVLAQALGDVRLPQMIRTVDDIPADGEIVRSRLGGYLKLGASMTWGYSFAGSKGVELSELELALEYKLKAAASVSVGYRLAGNFVVEARAGHAPKWLRLVVRKDRESEFNFAADFGLEADIALEGLPESADEFLAALLGTDAENLLAHFQHARKYSDMAELEAAVGKVAKGFVHDLAKQYVGSALKNSNLQQFLEVMNQVVSSYQSVDDRIVGLYTSFAGRVPELGAALDRIAAVTDREALDSLGSAAASDALEVARLLYRERFYDVLVDDEAFGKLQDLVARARGFLSGDAEKPLRQFLEQVKASFPLDDLLTKLADFDTAEELESLADENLQGLVEEILGSTFEKITSGNVGAAAQKLHAVLQRVEAFKNAWYAKLTESVSQSFALDVNYSYSRVSRDEVLLDVEVYLGRKKGRVLSEAAARGDFAELLTGFDPANVRIHTGRMTHELTKTSQVQINIFGWRYSGLVQLMQNLSHAIESKGGGLVHVYTLETAIKQRKSTKDRDGFNETVESNLVLGAVGQALQAPREGAPLSPSGQFLMKSVERLTVAYDFLVTDERTDPVEMRNYLQLAERLGLLDRADAYEQQLQREFPNGLGKVSARYEVRYDSSHVLRIFELPDLDGHVKRITRDILGAAFTDVKQTDWKARVGFAYLAPESARIYYRDGFTALRNGVRSVVLPSWFTAGPPQRVSLRASDVTMLVTLFNVESDLADKLRRLDALVDAHEPIPVDELARATRKFVGLADDLDRLGRVNAFFAVFDRLVQLASQGKARHRSALVLEITPPGQQTVRKLVMGNALAVL